MAVTIKQYSIAEFEKISNNGIEYTLDPTVIKIIEQISSQVDVVEHSANHRSGVKTPYIKRHGGRTQHDKECTIKITTKDSVIKTDIDMCSDTIRKLLNKITEKTYNTLFPEIIKEFDNVILVNDEYKKKISLLVLSIVSESLFYSHMYAILYTYLLEHYDFLREELDNRVNTFKSWIEEITYFNPDTEYDLFCKNNKENLKRKSVGIFLVNLAKLKVLDNEKICDIIVYLQRNIMETLDEENKAEINVELTEIFGDMVIAGKDFLNSSGLWITIISNINILANKKPKEHKSLTTKAIFKNMDLIDSIG